MFAMAWVAMSPWISMTARFGGLSPRSTIARERAPDVSAAEFTRQIDPRDPATEAVRDVARGPTDSAANVKNVVGGASVHQVGDFRGRLETATVELVVGRQRLEARILGIPKHVGATLCRSGPILVLKEHPYVVDGIARTKPGRRRLMHRRPLSRQGFPSKGSTFSRDGPTLTGVSLMKPAQQIARPPPSPTSRITAP